MGQFKAKESKSADGRQIITVRFVRQTPEAEEPTIAAVFHYVFPESFCLTASNPGVLALLSVSREDTLESVLLSDEEKQLVYTAASEYATELMQG